MININIDLSAIVQFRDGMENVAKTAIQEAARNLSTQAYAHILEKAQSELHSSRDKYVGALGFTQVSPDVWLVTLDQSAMWIEQGLPRHSMVENLLSSPKAKTSKTGERYLVVPFQHNKGPTSQTKAQKDLADTVKAELKKRKIPYGKLETNELGKPKTGLLHSFNIMDRPLKTHQGPGQGHGAVGQVRQGTTGIPFLQGIRVYQKEIKDQASGKSKIVKNIMTFRVVSSKHAGTSKWIYPGIEGKFLFEDCATWSLNEWETKIVPDLLSRFASSI